MTTLYEKSWNKTDLPSHLSDPAQMVGVRPCILQDSKAEGVKAAQINTSAGLQFTILPGRGMDIPDARYQTVRHYGLYTSARKTAYERCRESLRARQAVASADDAVTEPATETSAAWLQEHTCPICGQPLIVTAHLPSSLTGKVIPRRRLRPALQVVLSVMRGFLQTGFPKACLCTKKNIVVLSVS